MSFGYVIWVQIGTFLFTPRFNSQNSRTIRKVSYSGPLWPSLKWQIPAINGQKWHWGSLTYVFIYDVD